MPLSPARLPACIRELSAIAAGRLGVFTSQEALRVGYRVEDIRAELRTRRWSRLRKGVYIGADRLASADARERHLIDCVAVLLSLGPGPVLSHASAARLHDLILPRRHVVGGPGHGRRPVAPRAWIPRRPGGHRRRRDGTVVGVRRDVGRPHAGGLCPRMVADRRRRRHGCGAARARRRLAPSCSGPCSAGTHRVGIAQAARALEPVRWASGVTAGDAGSPRHARVRTAAAGVAGRDP